MGLENPILRSAACAASGRRLPTVGASYHAGLYALVHASYRLPRPRTPHAGRGCLGVVWHTSAPRWGAGRAGLALHNLFIPAGSACRDGVLGPGAVSSRVGRPESPGLFPATVRCPVGSSLLSSRDRSPVDHRSDDRRVQLACGGQSPARLFAGQSL